MMLSLATRPGFAVRHPRDRAFFLVCLLVIWAAMLGGFGLDMARKVGTGRLHYPLIVYAHAVVFGAWLILLTAQILLIRRGDYATHRRLGVAAVVLIPLMLVLGPAAALKMASLRIADPKFDPAFMATQFTNVLGCVVLLTAGLAMRRDAAAHKRLMLLGTIAITEPGFSRIWAGALHGVFGDGFWNYLAVTYPGTIAMVLGMGAYDYATRRRLHPAWVVGALWIFANEATAAYLYYQPWWAAFTRSLVPV